jgi:hypothetical protein
MGTCQKIGCNNKIFSHSYCRLHQWLRTDEAYKKQKEYAKENRKAKKQIPKESPKRKKEHLSYTEQVKLFKQEHKDNGTYFCFISGEEFDNTIDGFCTVHHLRGRTGDYYIDKEFWILAKNKHHLDVFHRCAIEELKEKEYWEDFLNRLRIKDYHSYCKLLKRIEKSEDLFD